MDTLIVDLTISADEYLKRYKRSSAVVLAFSRDGRRVQFPASLLQPYVTHSGVVGSFQIEFEAAGKFSNIVKLEND